MNAPQEAMRFGSGHAVRRIEDPALVRGLGQSTDDDNPAGQTFAAFVRSPMAHARFGAIDTAAVLAMPGVLAVHTGAELVAAGVKPIVMAPALKRPDGQPMAAAPRLALAHEVVRYAGEGVAAVVATSRTLAQTAAEAIEIDYEVLPSVVDPVEAVKPGAPVVWPEAQLAAAQAAHGKDRRCKSNPPNPRN